jgi:hypothetical protein
MIGDDGSLYFGSGPQTNILKGHGGGQDAWYGYIRREGGDVYFYGRKKLPFTPEYKTKTGRAEDHPASLKTIKALEKEGVPEDQIVDMVVERGLTRGLIRVLKNPRLPEYQEIDELVAMELVEKFGIVPYKPKVRGQMPEPEPEVETGRYGVHIDDFTASIMGGYSDEKLADEFNITPLQAKSLRLHLGFKAKGGRAREYDYDMIRQLFEKGLRDEEIAAKIEEETGKRPNINTVSNITIPLRVDQIEILHKEGHDPETIAHKLGLNLKGVSRAVNRYEKRRKSMAWCSKHRTAYNEKFGCPKCRNEGEEEE